MLGKLFKYEFKASARKLVPLYGASLIFTLINKVTLSFEDIPESYEKLIDVISAISMFLLVASMVAVFVLTLYVILERFYKNLYGDEGYLTFTLPVRPWKHILVKLLTSVAWTLISGIIGTISLMILFYEGNMFDDISIFLGEIAAEIFHYTSIDIRSLFIAITALSLVSIFTGILMLYLSISVGQLFSKHKILASFGAFLAINTLSDIISNSILGIGFTDVERWFNNATIKAEINSLLTVSFMQTIIYGIIYWAVINYIINRKLNLE